MGIMMTLIMLTNKSLHACPPWVLSYGIGWSSDTTDLLLTDAPNRSLDHG